MEDQQINAELGIKKINRKKNKKTPFVSYTSFTKPAGCVLSGRLTQRNSLQTNTFPVFVVFCAFLISSLKEIISILVFRSEGNLNENIENQRSYWMV